MTRLLEPLLLPPTLITFGLTVCVALLWNRRRTQAARVMLTVLVACYYLLSIWPVANLAAASLQADFRRPRVPGGDERVHAIVVLAGAANAAGPLRPEAELNGETWLRLWRGIQVFDQFQGAVPLIYSGADVETGHTGLIAQAMGRWGLAEERWSIESKSTNTYESGVALARLLRARYPGVDRPRILLVTSAWHMRRARGVFQALRVDSVPVPCHFLGGPTGMGVAALMPDSAAFGASTIVVREWLGIVSYRLRGRL